MSQSLYGYNYPPYPPPLPRAPVIAGWILLSLSWGLLLLPVFLCGMGTLVGWALNVAAFVMAIVVLARGQTAMGLAQILCALVVSPLVFFVGGLLLAHNVAGTTTNSAQPSFSGWPTRSSPPTNAPTP